MPGNVVYFCGPHGSGKSTLIERIAASDTARFARFERIPIPHEQETFERTKIRTARYHLQTFYERDWAGKNPDRTLLCDRSVLDNYAYILGFQKLGWAGKDELDSFLALYDGLFPPERRPGKVVFIDLPLETLSRHIRKRWAETGEKKWREDNFGYLDAVRQGFQDVFEKYEGDVLRLATDDRDEQVRRVLGWMQTATRESTAR
jgi:thymidylate kinase